MLLMVRKHIANSVSVSLDLGFSHLVSHLSDTSYDVRINYKQIHFLGNCKHIEVKIIAYY